MELVVRKELAGRAETYRNMKKRPFDKAAPRKRHITELYHVGYNSLNPLNPFGRTGARREILLLLANDRVNAPCPGGRRCRAHTQ